MILRSDIRVVYGTAATVGQDTEVVVRVPGTCRGDCAMRLGYGNHHWPLGVLLLCATILLQPMFRDNAGYVFILNLSRVQASSGVLGDTRFGILPLH